MQFRARLNLAFTRLQRRYRIARDYGLGQTAGLIRREAREKIRIRSKSLPPKPPSPGTTRTTISARQPGGLRVIYFHVMEARGMAIIGPLKFRNSNFFNQPVPRIHERGGTVIRRGVRTLVLRRYPERSYMYVAVKRLQQKGLIARRFVASLQRVI